MRFFTVMYKGTGRRNLRAFINLRSRAVNIKGEQWVTMNGWKGWGRKSRRKILVAQAHISSTKLECVPPSVVFSSEDTCGFNSGVLENPSTSTYVTRVISRQGGRAWFSFVKWNVLPRQTNEIVRAVLEVAFRGVGVLRRLSE